MDIICSWCNKKMGEKEGTGTTHSICKKCKKKLMKEYKEEMKNEKTKKHS